MMKRLLLLTTCTFLFHIRVVAQESKPCPDELSFCIADTKFDGSTLKLLEFGEGGRSKFAGHDRMYGLGSIWIRLWNQLKEYNIPVWCVRMPDDPDLRPLLAPDTFFQLGGKTASSIANLEQSIRTDIQKEKGSCDARDCADYKALVLVKKGRPHKAIESFKQRFPKVVFIGDRSNKFVNNKYYTNLLFQSDELRPYRPACKACDKKYTPQLAQDIINELSGDLFVIKPINACRGNGIIFVEKDNLDQTLKLILEDPKSLEQSDYDDSITYWANDPNDIFLVEQYVPSKPILSEGKLYDATLRLVFTIENVNDTISLHLVGAYWKLPIKALDESGSLIEKHKSDIAPTHLCSAPVSTHDTDTLNILLTQLMLPAYQRMLQTKSFLHDLPWIITDDQSF